MARLPDDATLDAREDPARRPAAASPPSLSRDELLHASRLVDGGLRRADLSVPSIHCGGCIRKIERALDDLDGVEQARVNLSTRRLSVAWRATSTVPRLVETLSDLGYPAHLDVSRSEAPDRTLAELVRSLAVAGFATGNIMLLSVSVWSGADPAARDLFHLVSAMIALPALAYSGRIFFRSAAKALRHGRANMDVPISIGVLLAFALSLFETISRGEHVYFEASVMLLFFLLIGRTLEHLMREKARRAITGLAKLVPRVAQVVRPDGTSATLPVADIEPGMTVLVPAGERVPVDGKVTGGFSEVDRALVTGESAPHPVRAGGVVQAGTLNLTNTLTVSATAAEHESFLAEMVRLMETAEAGRPRYRRVADQAARLYVPVVHLAALAGFAGWMVATGDLHLAVTVAVAVLIITCPCALGLAAPMVQVVAARRMFERGIMVRDGMTLEGLAEVDTVVFDKTGTLTRGSPVLTNPDAVAPTSLAIAAAMAAHSRHPLSQALAVFEDEETCPISISGPVLEHPGCGLKFVSNGTTWRLGQADWALEEPLKTSDETGLSETVLSRDGQYLDIFRFRDPLRPGARDALETLKQRGLEIHLLSGDRMPVVRELAAGLELDLFQAEMRPQDKVARLEALARDGHKVLMVGDGLNDAPALTAAHVSMAPGSAADVGRNAAGLVFLGDSLEAVPAALALSARTHRLVRQNFAFASLYNAVALPFAILGYVTPLTAALAMSLSSIAVVANSLRLGGGWRPGDGTARTRDDMAGKLSPEPAE